MTRKGGIRVLLALAALSAGGVLYAAGSKTNGSTEIVDDLPTGSAGRVAMSSGVYKLSGTLAQVGQVVISSGTNKISGGYFTSGSPDTTPPGAVTNLSIAAIVSTGLGASTMSVTLTWTSPGENGSSGELTGGTFLIRYSSWGPVSDDSAFAGATGSVDIGTNASPGAMQSYMISGLDAATSWYFAIKTADSSNSTSTLSVGATALSYVIPIAGTGDSNQSAVWGDYDGDGDLDFAAAGSGANDYVARNDGGVFTKIVLAGTSGSGKGIAWGDYDGDGDLDLAVAKQSGADVSIARNDGGSTFSTFSVTGSGGDSAGLAWGDPDNDGDLDLAVANAGSEDEYLVVNDGNGGLTKASPNPLSGSGLNSWGVAWGDYDRDGDVDLAVANAGGANEYIARNDGDLTFGIVTLTGTGGDSRAIAWGDYDGDGDLDLAMAAAATDSHMARNNGNGTFTGFTLTGIGGQPGAVSWGDYDDDGDLDMVSADFVSGRAFLVRNDGSEVFVRVELNGTEGASDGVSFGDYDDDGDLDVLATDHGATGGDEFLARNDLQRAHSPPSSPAGGFGSAFQAYSAEASSGVLTLSWDAGSDAQTPATTLNYFVRVGSSPTGGEVLKIPKRYGLDGHSGGGSFLYSTWLSTSQRGIRLNGISQNATYFWAVVAEDGTLARSAESAEQAVFVPVSAPDSAFTAPGQNAYIKSNALIFGTAQAFGGEDVSQVEVSVRRMSDGLYFNGAAFASAAQSWQAANFTGASSGSWNYSQVTAPALTDGVSYYAQVRVTDSLAQVGVSTDSRTFTFDTTLPVVGISAPADGSTQLGWATVSGTAFDTVAGVAQVLIRISSAPNYDTFWSSATQSWTSTAIYQFAEGTNNWLFDGVPTGANLSYGTSYFLDVRVADAAGNESVAVSTFYLTGWASSWNSMETENTYSVAWGDFDNDGDLDLAAGNTVNQTNRVYRNDGGGGLSGTWNSAEAAGTYSVAWGDYDNDGDLDLAAGNGGQPNRVYRNDGGGSFAMAWNSAETDFTFCVAWGDYDNDGDLDLAAGNYTSQTNRIYHNDGGGSFAAAWNSAEAEETYSVAWGDYDNDGDLDLAAGNNVTNRIYRNDGGGSLSAAWNSTAAEDTFSVAWGDYDNDGDLDLAAGNDGQTNRVYRNDGGGSFVAAWNSTETEKSISFAWGDFDNDGDLDLVAGNSGNQTNRVYRNYGGGSFASAWNSVEPESTASVAWGDYDNDGHLDFAAGNYTQTNRVYRGFLLGANAAPASPAGLSISFEYGSSLSTMTLKWDAGDYDSNGSTASVYYAVAVATLPTTVSPDGKRIVSPSSYTAGSMIVPWSDGSPLLGNYLRPAYKTWPGDGSAKHGVYLSTTPNLPGGAIQTDTTYYFRVQTIDAGLARSSWSAEIQSYIPANPLPQSAFVFPLTGQVYNSVTYASGTGQAFSGSVSLVELAIRRESDGVFWDWISAFNGGPAYTAVPFVGTATVTWSQNLSGLGWVSGSSYTILSRVTADFNAVQSPPTESLFTYDADAPVAAITAPSAAFASAVSTVAGTAIDAVSGVAEVWIAISSGSGESVWWSDSTRAFTVSQANIFWSTQVYVSGADWSYAPVELTAALVDGVSYKVHVKVRDAAGNWFNDVTPPGSSALSFAFTADKSAPTASASTLGGPGAIETDEITLFGTAVDPTPPGAAAISSVAAAGDIYISIRQTGSTSSVVPSASDYYWNGSSWTLNNDAIDDDGAVCVSSGTPANCRWVKATTFNPTTHDWTYTGLGAGGTLWPRAKTYFARVRAKDAAGNLDAPAEVAGAGHYFMVAAPAVSFALSIATGPYEAGVAVPAAVSALDDQGLAALGYTGTIAFSVTDGGPETPGSGVPAGYTFQPGDLGTKPFPSGFALRKSGFRLLRVEEPLTPAINGTAAVVVDPSAPSSLLVLLPGEVHAPGTAQGKTGVPSPQSLTQPETSFQLTVKVVDDFYNTVTASSMPEVQVGLADDGLATPPAAATLALGERIFSVTPRVALSTYTVGASTTASSLLSISSATGSDLIVYPGPAHHFHFENLPSTVVAGASFSAGLDAHDKFHNRLSTGPNTYLGTVQLSAEVFAPPQDAGFNPLNVSFLAGDAGYKILSNAFTLKKAGSRWIMGTDLSSPTAHTEVPGYAVQPAIAVVAGSPAAAAVSPGPASSLIQVRAGSLLNPGIQAVTGQMSDAFNNAVSSPVEVTIEIVEVAGATGTLVYDPGGGWVSIGLSTTVWADAQGRIGDDGAPDNFNFPIGYMVSSSSGDAARVWIGTIPAPGDLTPYILNQRNVSATIATIGGTPAQLAFVSSTPAFGASGSPDGGGLFIVERRDDFGNPTDQGTTNISLSLPIAANIAHINNGRTSGTIFTTTGDFGFTEPNSPNNFISAATIPDGITQASFRFRDTLSSYSGADPGSNTGLGGRSGTWTLQLSATGLTPDPLTFPARVDPGPPASLGFGNLQNRQVAGRVHDQGGVLLRSFQPRLLDSFGNPAVATAPVSVLLSTVSRLGAELNDAFGFSASSAILPGVPPAFETPAAAATIPSLSYETTFFYLDTTATAEYPAGYSYPSGFSAAPVIEAADAASVLGSTRQAVTVIADVQTRIGVRPVPGPLAAGSSSQIMVFEISDGFGNASPLQPGQEDAGQPGAAFTLNSNSTGTVLFSSPGFGEFIPAPGSATVFVGFSSGTFALIDPAAGSSTWTLTVDELQDRAWTAGVATYTVVPGQPVAARFANPPRRLIAGTTVQLSTATQLPVPTPLEVELLDAFGNAAVSTWAFHTVLVNSIDSPSTRAGLDDTKALVDGADWVRVGPADPSLAATIPPLQTKAVFWVWDTVAGTSSITGQVVRQDAFTMAAATDFVRITPGPADYITIHHAFTSTGPLKVNVPGVFGLTVRDTFGNTATGDPVNKQYFEGLVAFSASGSTSQVSFTDLTASTSVPDAYWFRGALDATPGEFAAMSVQGALAGGLTIWATAQAAPEVNGFTSGPGSSGDIPVAGVAVTPLDLAPEAEPDGSVKPAKAAVGQTRAVIRSGDGSTALSPDPVAMLRLDLRTLPVTAAALPAALSRLQVRKTGLLDPGRVSELGLWYDEDGDGLFSAGGDLLLGTAAYSAGNWTFGSPPDGLTPLELADPARTAITTVAKRFFLAVRMEPEGYAFADLPSSLGLALDGPASVVLSTSSAIGISAANFAVLTATSAVLHEPGPIRADGSDIAAFWNGTDISGSTLGVSSYAYVDQGTQRVGMLALKLWTDRSFGELGAVRVARLGTGSDAGVSRVRLFADTDASGDPSLGDGIFEPAIDAEVTNSTTAATFSAGSVWLALDRGTGAFAAERARLSASTNTYFVAFDMSTAAVPGDTYGAAVSGPSDLSLYAGFGAVQAFASIQSTTPVVRSAGPGRITDLAAGAPVSPGLGGGVFSTMSVTLSWTSPGFRGEQGAITGGTFAIRGRPYFPIIDDAAFAAAPFALDIPTDTSPGAYNEIILGGLDPAATWYFAVSAVNGLNFTGGLSNGATAPSYIIEIPGTEALSYDLAWGDYDGDGDLDLAIANETVDAELLRNEGGGVFSTITLTGSGGSWGLAWGDYDNDGDLDLALARSPGDELIMRNDGGGTFTKVVLTGTGGNSWELAWGDFDNDGRLDLAVGDDSDPAYLARNEGGGAFTQTFVPAPPNGIGHGVAWGDYDSDGDIDLALTGGISGDLYAARNDAAVFSTFTVLPRFNERYSVGWADFDGDGDLDLAASNLGAQAVLARNDGGGAFTEISIGGSGGGGDGLAWADYDDDGDPDLAIPSPGGDSYLLRNDGGGAFAQVDLPGTGKFKFGAAWGDIDGDGDLDLALGKLDSPAKPSREMILRNDSAQGNSPPSAPASGLSAAWSPYSLGSSSAALTLSWDGAADAETPAVQMNYFVRVGTAPGAAGVLALPRLFASNRGLGTSLYSTRLSTGQRGISLSVQRNATYYWAVAAEDGGFRRSPESAERSVFISAPPSGIPPSAGITVPASSHRATLAFVAGTADDPEGFLLGVRVGFFDAGAARYWNGSAFISAAPLYFDAAGLASWAYDASAIPWADGGSYRIEAFAIDAGGQHSSTATVNFTFDTAAPSGAITYPAAGTIAGSIAAISGTAADPGTDPAGPGAVELRVRRLSDDKYFDFASGAWTASVVSTAAAISTSPWAFPTDSAFQDGLQSGNDYVITARIFDAAAPPNAGVFSSSAAAFTYVDSVPPAAVSDLAAGATDQAGTVLLSWTAPGDSGERGSLASGSRFLVQRATFAAAAWSPGAAQVSVSTSGVAPGSVQGLRLDGLRGGATLYFRVWTVDPAGNASQASGVAPVFLPLRATRLVLVAPGQAFDEGTGRTGTASVQPTFAPFTVTVYAVDPSSTIVAAADASVRVAVPGDAGAVITSSQTLAAGQAAFSVALTVPQLAPVTALTVPPGVLAADLVPVPAINGTNMIVQAASLAPGVVQTGQANIPMLRLDLRTGGGSLGWSAVALGVSASTQGMRTVALYRDDDGDKALDPNSDALVGAVAPSAIPVALSFASEAIAGSTKTYFLAVSASSNAAVGDRFGLVISSAGAFSVSGGSVALQGIYPIASGEAAVAPPSASAGDATKPASAVLVPADGTSVRTLAAVAGTAADNVQVDRVLAAIRRSADGKWWNGSSWVFSQDVVQATAAYIAPFWSYAAGPSSASLSAGGAYEILSWAVDTAGNWQAPPASVSVSVDSAAAIGDITPPVSAILAPVSGAVLSEAGTISGTAADEGALDRVEVALRDESAGLWWNGAGWSAGGTLLNRASLAGGFWSYAGPDASFLTDGSSYTVYSRALDASGNFQAPLANSSFTFQTAGAAVSSPTAVVVRPANGAVVTSLGLISGTLSGDVGEIRLTLADRSAGTWWKGSAQSWVASPATNYGSFSAGFWEFAAGPGESFLAPASSFTITVEARNSAGTAVQTPAWTTTVLTSTGTAPAPAGDKTPPSAAILSPAKGAASIVSLGAVSGTAVDDTGVERVFVGVQRKTDGLWWAEASGWVAAQAGNFADLASPGANLSAWSYSALPDSYLAIGSSYTVFAWAKDAAGNLQSPPAARTFEFAGTVVVDTTPPAGITGLVAASTAPGAAVLAWTAPGGDGWTGRAAGYIVHFSTAAPLTNANFFGAPGLSANDSFAMERAGVYDAALPPFNTPSPSPGEAGSLESMTINALVPGKTYHFGVRAADAAGNLSFSFNSAAAAIKVPVVPGDGSGAGAWAPAAPPVCSVIGSTFAFTAGTHPFQAGGLIAVKVPESWPEPQLNCSSCAAFVRLTSTSAATLELTKIPELGSRFIGVRVLTGTLLGGERASILFDRVLTPPSARSGVRPPVLTRASWSGKLSAIEAPPSFDHVVGPAVQARFEAADALTLGPSQASPAVRLVGTDACGNPAAPAVPKTVSVSGAASDFGADAGAELSASPGFSPPAAGLDLVLTSTLSAPFYYRNALGGARVIRATTTDFTDGSTVRSIARPVFVTGTAIGFLPGTLSVDTGTAVSGRTEATITPDGDGVADRAVISFTPTTVFDWSVTLSTTADFSSVWKGFSGSGAPGRSLVWDGTDSGGRRIRPGAYFVRVQGGDGVAVDTTTLSVAVSAAGISGTVRLGGAPVEGARVRVSGAGVDIAEKSGAAGDYAVYGLVGGTTYFVSISYYDAASSRTAVLITTAAVPGGDFSLALPSRIRVAGTLVEPAPVELNAQVAAQSLDLARTAYARLRFAAGSSSSDDGAASPSSWTVFDVQPDTYAVRMTVPGYDAFVTTVVVGASQVVDVAHAFTRKANIYGVFRLPELQKRGTPVSIEAFRAGSAAPSYWTSLFLPGLQDEGRTPALSGIYALYGVEPGTYTLTARAAGFSKVSTGPFAVGISDVGRPDAGGADFPQPAYGGTITGTVYVRGDSSDLSSIDLSIGAWDPLTLANGFARLALGPSAALSSGVYRISGLVDGTYDLRTYLKGFELVADTTSAGGVPSAAVSSSGAHKDLTLKRHSGGVRAVLLLPAGSSDYEAVSLSLSGPDTALSTSDATGVSGASFTAYASSAVWTSRAVLGSGIYKLRAKYRTTGALAAAEVPVVNGRIADATLDLRGQTRRVSGTVSLSGGVTLAFGTYTLTAGTIGELAAAAAKTPFCGPAYGGCVSTTSFRMELYPFETGLDGVPRPSYGNGLFAPIAADGAYEFPFVPPGIYLLSGQSELDGDPSDGSEIPAVNRTIAVGTAAVTASISVVSGRSVSGRFDLPEGRTDSLAFDLYLKDRLGAVVHASSVSLEGESGAAFTLFPVAEGDYLFVIEDPRSPPVFVAAPVPVAVRGGDATIPDAVLLAAGSIKGKISVKQVTVSGSSTVVTVTPITAENVSLLPGDLSISAVADPWTEGGTGAAGLSADGRIALDAQGRFSVTGLPAARYRVSFARAGSGGDWLGQGGFNLAPFGLAGVAVSQGQATDIGTVELRPGQTVGGRIVDADENSLPNIPVVAFSGGHSVETRTDSSGTYSLNGLDPARRYYDIWAARREKADAGGAEVPYEAVLLASVDILAQTGGLDITLNRADASLECAVSASDGGSLLNPDPAYPDQPGAKVYLQKIGLNPLTNPFGDLSADTDAGGSVTISNLAPGDYTLTAAAAGYRVNSSRITLRTGANTGCAVSLDAGGTLSGVITRPDKSNPNRSEVAEIWALPEDRSATLIGTLRSPGKSEVVDHYSITGFKTGVSYQLIIIDSGGAQYAPPEAAAVVFDAASSKKTLNIHVRPVEPTATAEVAKNADGTFSIVFRTSKPIRSLSAEDEDASGMLTASTGALTAAAIKEDRREVSADLDLAEVSLSSSTVAFRAWSNVEDPDAAGGYLAMAATATVFVGVEAKRQTNISAAKGGKAAVGGTDPSFVSLPANAMDVDGSSVVAVGMQSAKGNNPNKFQGQGLGTGGRAGPRFGAAAYPEELYKALAAAPPSVNPLSSFYDVFLPLGLRTQLRKPAELVIHYDSATVSDPSQLNLYWFNPASNLYVLQADALGFTPEIDAVNHTIKVRVNHFSTFVLLDSQVSVITDTGTFAGAGIEAFNYPNPFDLNAKTVNLSKAPGLTETIRGTMIRVGLSGGLSGDVRVLIYNVAGERVRTLSFTTGSGGKYSYVHWDGRNDAGADCASGLYIAEVKAGGEKAFFKMALIK